MIEKDIKIPTWNKILQEVNNGSTALIFNTEFPRKIKDTLNFRSGIIGSDSSHFLELTDSKLKADTLNINKLPNNKGFHSIDATHQILGNTHIIENGTDHFKSANFIKVKFGKGELLLHTEPLVLTNYYLLNHQPQYVEKVFSYLPNQKTIWFVGQKEKATEGNNSTPLKFILANPPLRYAYYLGLAGLLTFVLFNVKRKQRIIPVIEPLKNTSVEFVKSIGNLYLQEGDFHDMMAKKAQYFLNRVRQELMIDTHRLDEDFAKKLQQKTGKPIEKITRAIDLIKKAQDPTASVLKEELKEINSLLNEILKP